MGDPDPDREKLDALAAQIRQAGAKPKEPRREGEAAPLRMGRIGFDFLGTVLGSILAGGLVDWGLKTRPWGLVAMIFIGFAVAVANAWRALGMKQD